MRRAFFFEFLVVAVVVLGLVAFLSWATRRLTA